MKKFFVWCLAPNAISYLPNDGLVTVEAESDEEALRLAGGTPDEGVLVVTRSSEDDPSDDQTRAFGPGYCPQCRRNLATVDEENGCTLCVA